MVGFRGSARMDITFVSQERLLFVFDYDPDSGVLKKKWSHRYSEIGIPCNEKKVGVDGYRPPSSHIIWKMMTGENVPVGFEVDHRDRNHDNDRWGNLRLATRMEQCQNKKVNHTSQSGYKGVRTDESRIHGKYTAHIMANKVWSLLGRFDSAEEAAWVYDNAAKELHGEFAVLNGVSQDSFTPTPHRRPGRPVGSRSR